GGELVAGDIIRIEGGDRIPADARLVRTVELRTLEAALTGESVPVEKNAQRVLADGAALADRQNMVYMATIVASGKGTAVVVATGMQTELGRLAGLIARYQPEPTPLQRRLAELGKVVILVGGGIAALTFALGAVRGGRLARRPFAEV